MENKELKIASPWVIFYRQINALFGDDPEIKVTFDEEENVIKLYVDNTDKAAAIEKLVPLEKTFGNVTVRVAVIPANMEEKSKLELYETAFKGNPAFVNTISLGGGIVPSLNYVVFKKTVVQFHADDLGDPHGNISTLYQEIAKDVFEGETGLYFCTDNGYNYTF